LQKIHALSEFVKHATARASAAQDQALAERTLAALDDAHAQYARLRSVEDAIWGGRIDGDVLDALGAMGGEPSSKIAAAIEVSETADGVGLTVQSRLALLRSTVAEQLSKAWSVAVVVSEGAVTVKRKLRLHLPTSEYSF
jgi:hypothetical protein